MASKARIRRLTAETLAELGYGRGQYGWGRENRRVVLTILAPSHIGKLTYNIAGGSSLAKVRSILACVPRAGGPRPFEALLGDAALRARRSVQLDIEAAL